MKDLEELIRLIERDGLASIRPGSKDPLHTHSAHFANALERYLEASQRAYADAVDRNGAIDMSIIEAPAKHYDLCATLYAPGLVGTLAAATVELEATLGKVKQLARAALADADSKGAVAWRDALQAIVTEIRELADG